MAITFDQTSLDAFARTVAHLLAARASVSNGAARSFDELVALACRKVDEIAPVNVSVKAHEIADQLGLGDLRTYCWFCPIMGKLRDDKKKRLFLWEHVKPVADTQREIRALGPNPTTAHIAEILSTTRIAWVHREEGKALGNTSRPDPDEAYRNAGVTLKYRWEDCGPSDCRRHAR